jgi:hypothetical protein
LQASENITLFTLGDFAEIFNFLLDITINEDKIGDYCMRIHHTKAGNATE